MEKLAARNLTALLLLIFTLVGFSFVVIFTSAWGIYVDFILFKILRPLGIDHLHYYLAITIAFSAVFLPLMVCGGAIGLLFRHFSQPSLEDTCASQIKRMAEAQKTLESALLYFQRLSTNLTEKSAELQTVLHELDVQKALHEENAKLLKDKMNYIKKESLLKKILSHAVTFLLGIISSITATYILDFME